MSSSVHAVYVWKFESLVTQSCLTLCNPMDCRLPGSSVHGIFQARVLEWVAISFSRGSSWPRDRTQVSHIVGKHFTVWAKSITCFFFSKKKKKNHHHCEALLISVCLHQLLIGLSGFGHKDVSSALFFCSFIVNFNLKDTPTPESSKAKFDIQS